MKRILEKLRLYDRYFRLTASQINGIHRSPPDFFLVLTF